jgi:phosphate starvation-inducible protein PhoH
MVVTGDLAQADRLNDNGLINFCNLIANKTGLKHIDIVQFDAKDIERHNAVKEVLAVYGE